LESRVVRAPSLPNCLRECAKIKFKDFDEYQLGKHCSEGNRKRSLLKEKKAKNIAPAQHIPSELNRFLQTFLPFSFLPFLPLA